MTQNYSKLTTISRRDLTPGQQAVQSSHALVDFCFQYPEIAKEWHTTSNYLVQLSVLDLNELNLVIEKLQKYQIKFTIFREPDLDNQITAVAIEHHPDLKRVISNLPLMLRENKIKEEIVMSFNKKHNEDRNIPQWLIKSKGETFYVNHVNIDKGVGFSTKETPENPHTKGSLKFKGQLKIEKENDLIVANIL